ncbi:hypothetical protein CLF_102346 [Clonorchis sinensis]|uniref:Uncharacterized protein n=1 Tax=Clonorchis sinensis TaxID=79923 RepID=G7Y7Q4_CLOSI|nr:hypothetical protein CLF_102346 [Clonorchis sinensis]
MREHNPISLSGTWKKPGSSAIASHLAETNHVIDKDQAFTIIYQAPLNRSRLEDKLERNGWCMLNFCFHQLTVSKPSQQELRLLGTSSPNQTGNKRWGWSIVPEADVQTYECGVSVLRLTHQHTLYTYKLSGLDLSNVHFDVSQTTKFVLLMNRQVTEKRKVTNNYSDTERPLTYNRFVPTRLRIDDIISIHDETFVGQLASSVNRSAISRPVIIGLPIFRHISCTKFHTEGNILRYQAIFHLEYEVVFVQHVLCNTITAEARSQTQYINANSQRISRRIMIMRYELEQTSSEVTWTSTNENMKKRPNK